MLNTRPLELTDFSGGMTENHIGAALNKFYLADNFLITDDVNKKLITRPGSELWHDQIPPGAARVGRLINYNFGDDLLVQSSGSIYQWSAYAYCTITIASPAVVTCAGHGLSANDAIQFATSGALPTGLATSTTYYVKTVLTVDTFTVSATAGGAEINTAGTQSGIHTVLLPSSDWHKIVGPTGNIAFTDPQFSASIDTTNVLSYAQWNGHLFLTSDAMPTPMKIFKDGSSRIQLRNAGLPALASNPTVTPTAGAGSYIYAFTHRVSYTVGNRTFLDESTPVYVEVTAMADPAGGSPSSITVIPTLSNGGNNNYDTAAIDIRIYRTTNGGNTYYYIGAVDNGTATYSDTTSDATASANETLYTSGGVAENDQTPRHKFVTITNSIAYYGCIKDTDGSLIKNRIRQSIQNDPDSCPADFYIDLDHEITGLGTAKGSPIAITKAGVYRIDGSFDELGRGGMVATMINDTANCVSQGSVVETYEGLYWAGTEGFYFSNGYEVINISQANGDRYAELVQTAEQRRRINGAYDAVNRRVWWGVQEQTATDCSACWVCDARFGLSDNAVFTTVSGTSFKPTALAFISDTLYRGDTRGYVFEHDSAVKSDPAIDSNDAVLGRETIIFDYQSTAMNFGTDFVRKFVPRIVLECGNEGGSIIQLYSINDDNADTRGLDQIRFSGNIEWEDSSIMWGDDTLQWDKRGLLEAQRRFPATHLRCSYKQIQITNAFAAIANSTTFGTATVDATLKTITADTAGVEFPTYSIGYKIYFESSGYEEGFDIIDISVDKTTLTVSDSGNLLTDGSKNWVIRGYRKNDALKILGVVFHYALLGKTQQMYRGETGEP